MSSDVAIRIEGLGKAYRIKHQEQQITLAEQSLQRLRHPFHRAPVETFWALAGVDLEISRGEVLGLIGRNGAGKSTLLKILSRITPPTKGRVDVYGRVGSLLEVGTGFHPELTGRENIFLNGSILGMRKSEIHRQFDAIVEFAGVERFLDTPVKRYSSGMYVRLAFAVAAHLDTEVLLVDEVLAVGDQEFQDRCIRKMRDVTTTGRTVILVSHNLSSVRQLAERSVLLDRGRVAASGSTDDVLREYGSLVAQGWDRESHAGALLATPPIVINSVRVTSSSNLICGEPFLFDVDVEVGLESVARVSIGAIVRLLGRPIGADTIFVGVDDRPLRRYRFRVQLDSGRLAPGTYTVTIGVGATRDREPPGTHEHDVLDDAVSFSLSPPEAADWLMRNWIDAFGSTRLALEAVEISDLESIETVTRSNNDSS